MRMTKVYLKFPVIKQMTSFPNRKSRSSYFEWYILFDVGACDCDCGGDKRIAAAGSQLDSKGATHILFILICEKVDKKKCLR